MRTLVIMLALAVVALGCGGEKKADEKKADEKKTEKKTEKKAEEKKEEPKADEKAPEAPAEEKPAEEAPEAPAEEKAPEAPAEEKPADEAAAEEKAPEAPAEEKAPEPAKLVELDLSKAYEDVPVVIMAPEGATAKEAFGVVEVRNGDGFQLQVSTEDSNGLAGLKKEHEANTMNKLKQFVIDTPETILYESEIMGRSEFHFATYVKLADDKFVYCEDNKGPTYTQAQVEAMHAACLSARTPGAAPADVAAPAEEAPAAEGTVPAEEAAAPTGEEAPAAEAAAPAATGNTCDAYAKCCMAYADALGKVQGVPESAVTATKDGCKQIEQLKGMGDAATTACTQGLEAMKQAGEAYKAMPGFVWPAECK